jgi:hypothetical protein
MSARIRSYSGLAAAAALLVVCPLRSLAFIPRTDHSLMNASSGVVVVDTRSSAQTITRYRTLPGSGVTFNGVFCASLCAWPAVKSSRSTHISCARFTVARLRQAEHGLSKTPAFALFRRVNLISHIADFTSCGPDANVASRA